MSSVHKIDRVCGAKGRYRRPIGARWSREIAVLSTFAVSEACHREK